MSYKLFLDDYRQPYDVKWVDLNIDDTGWIIVRNYEQFVDMIETNGLPYFVTFDHDLADVHYDGNYTKEYTGMECAQWLVDYCRERNVELPKYAVHSMNPVGKVRILNTLRTNW